MKNILFFLLALTSPILYAQDKLPVVYLPESQTVHFISPEPIQYVDISNKNLLGNLPLKNVLRIKLRDSLKSFSSSIVTIAGENFLAQYRILPGFPGVPVKINIVPADMHPLDISGTGFSQNQLKTLALNLITKSFRKPVKIVKNFGIRGQLNHIYTLGDYEPV